MGVKVNCDWQYYQQAVTKIWKILDIETYEQAKGKSIDELVATLKQQRDDLLDACKYSHTLILRKIGQATHAVALLEAAIAKCEA